MKLLVTLAFVLRRPSDRHHRPIEDRIDFPRAKSTVDRQLRLERFKVYVFWEREIRGYVSLHLGLGLRNKLVHHGKGNCAMVRVSVDGDKLRVFCANMVTRKPREIMKNGREGRRCFTWRGGEKREGAAAHQRPIGMASLLVVSRGTTKPLRSDIPKQQRAWKNILVWR